MYGSINLFFYLDKIFYEFALFCMAINSKEHKRHLFCEPFLNQRLSGVRDDSLNWMIEQLYLSLNRTVFLRTDDRASKAGQLRAPFRRGLVIQRLFNRVHSHLMDTFEESIIILLFLNETFKKSISTDTFILVLPCIPVVTPYRTNQITIQKNRKQKQIRVIRITTTMAALLETFVNSFLDTAIAADPSSSSSSTAAIQKPFHRKKYERTEAIYTEYELIKVKARKVDLDRFERGISKLQHDVGIDVEITVVIPREEALEESKQRRLQVEAKEKETGDFLDYVFSDTIPFLHDFLMHGSPELRFFQIKGEKEIITVFNKLCERMIYNKDMQCKLEIKDRRQVQIGRRIIVETETYEEARVRYNKECNATQLAASASASWLPNNDLLDSMFTDDFSKSSPFLHNLLVS